MGHDLTGEQQIAIEHFRSGENLKIEAFAGAGKTSTLIAIAEAARDKCGHYFAFNKSIADDAGGRFPSSVSSSTVHSLAYQFVSHSYAFTQQKMLQNASINQLAHLLQAQPKQYYRLFDRMDLTGREYASVFQKALKNFLASSDDVPGIKHFERIGKLGAASDAELSVFAQRYLPNIEAIWYDMRDANSPYPLGHDGYLKLWGLSQPRMAKDYILLDEAQDTSDVVLNVLANQTCQVIYVGDEYQQIYEWRGAVNAMKKAGSKRVATLTLSFRFGQEIGDAAGLVLKKLDCGRSIQGNRLVNSKIGEHTSQTILCKSNLHVIETVVEHLDMSHRCFVVGGIRELVALLQEVSALKKGIPSRHPDLFGFEDWHDVISYCEEDPKTNLRVLVRLVKRFGEQQLIEILKRTATDDFDAQITVSTVHKSKGREWNRVEVHSGFDAQYLYEDGNSIGPADMRLFYVAMTRAKTHLQLPIGAKRYYGIVSD